MGRLLNDAGIPLCRVFAVADLTSGAVAPSKPPNSETNEAPGDGGTSVLLLLTLDIELLFRLILRVLPIMDGPRYVDWGELVVDVLPPPIRGILVGVSFSRNDEGTAVAVVVGGALTGPTEGEPAMVGRCVRELRRELSEALLAGEG